jgi:virulence factor Mce-like protein
MRLARFGLGVVGTLAILAAIVLAVVRFTGAGTKGYLVRAVFDNSSFVIPGEQVKVAGVVVGTIHAIDLTRANKAAVVLQITNRQFIPFRTDAHCQIGLESLLGEQFVQCTPTQPRPSGSPAPPPLAAIGSGPYRGQHPLGVQNTTTPVGLDLLNDIMRLPEAERFRLIIAGLGAGLAGNGQELNQALRRADPALEQTDHVIAVLASENHTLAQLTDDSARVLAPLAAQRQGLGSFISHAGTVAAASASESRAIAQNLQDFPAFLRQLRPYSNKLSQLADQMTPALQSLQAQAPAINASVHGLGPLAKRSIPAFVSLGGLARRGQSIFPRTHRLARQLLALSGPLLPLASDLGAVAQSFDNAGGIEDVMRFIYYYAGSVNGEDALGHYIRSLVQLSCGTQRTNQIVGGCNAKFSGNKLAATRAAATRTRAGSAQQVTAADSSKASQVAVAAVRAQQSAQSPSARTLLQYLTSP